jgi:hypothetical protein
VPTVFRHGAFRIFFYSNEGHPREPRHVHVRRGDAEAKLWLEPEIAIADSEGFNARTLAEIVQLIAARRREIERAWREHFGD